MIGNPPWDHIKLKRVEWFAARRPEIARAQRADDRKRMIAALQQDGDSLATEFEQANNRAASPLPDIARACGDYPFLAKGDINLYSLFVERAMALVKPDGIIGLLVPSGIAADKTAAPFFRSLATQGRLRALYDFENRRTRYKAPPFFPDVDSRFKFCAFIAGPSPSDNPAQCAFFLQDISELKDDNRCFPLTPEDFAAVNPNTGTAPIFRSRRDAELTTAIYRTAARIGGPFFRRGSQGVAGEGIRQGLFHSGRTTPIYSAPREELEEREGAWPIPSGAIALKSPSGEWVPLYEGKMVQAFDHRAADIRPRTRANQHPSRSNP